MANQSEQEFLDAYDAYADAIYRHCYFRVHDSERARDLMQDTFTKTWRYMQEGNKVNNLRALLYKVANNLIIDNSRKHRESSLDDMMEEGFDVEVNDKEKTERALEIKQVHKFFEQIDKKYRDVIVMRYVDDLAVKDIATILGETENTISVRVHRGLRQVRKLLHAQAHHG